MVTQEFRPQVFSEVTGHELVTKTLKCVVNNPKLAPKSIILQGEFGTGKTTCARILARALNCNHRTPDGDACGKCEICTGNIDKSIFYEEYDSAMVGNVEAIRSLRDTFYFNSDTGYKVIVIDECHLMSKQAQSALLKVIEEMTDNVFFIFCTTDIDLVLNTIRSRSLELRFNLVNEENIKQNLISIMVRKGLMQYVDVEKVERVDDKDIVRKYRTISNEDAAKYGAVLDLIAKRSMGHMRNAHMLLDQYFLLGDEFTKTVTSARLFYLRMLIGCVEGRRDVVEAAILKMQEFSLTNLKTDYESLVLELIKTIYGVQPLEDNFIKRLITGLGMYAKSGFIDVINDPKIYKLFGSDKQFQAAMYVIIQRIQGMLKIQWR